MPSKNPQPPAGRAHSKADDFRMINGLTRNFKVKLHQAGILKFAQLADLTAQEILAKIGEEPDLTIERIKRDDWIGQARKLADEAEKIRAQSTLADAETAEQYTSFVLELKLNQSNEVQQTRVMHIETTEKDSEETWTGWDPERLANFVVQRGKLKIPAPKPSSARAPEQATVSEPVKPSATDQPPAQKPESPLLSKFEVLSGSQSAHTFSLRETEPYQVRLTMNLAELNAYTDNRVGYRAMVSAKSLGRSHKFEIGAAEGYLNPDEGAAMNIACNKLPPGDYRLNALVTFNLLDGGQSYGLKSNFEGGLIHVY